MLERLHRLHPFQTPEARRLALLFAIVYFAQGMYDLPTQTLTLVLKERSGWRRGRPPRSFLIATIPWYVKPVYGLISDFVPLFGRRRKSYLVLTSGLAALSGSMLAFVADHTYSALVLFVTLMGLGLAFTDVLVDALMVEKGRPLGLTGAFNLSSGRHLCRVDPGRVDRRPARGQPQSPRDVRAGLLLPGRLVRHGALRDPRAARARGS